MTAHQCIGGPCDGLTIHTIEPRLEIHLHAHPIADIHRSVQIADYALRHGAYHYTGSHDEPLRRPKKYGVDRYTNHRWTDAA